MKLPELGYFKIRHDVRFLCMRIGFILLLFGYTIVAQHSIDLDSIVIQSHAHLKPDSFLSDYGFTLKGKQTYSIELHKIQFDASSLLSRQLFAKIPALQTLEHDASGTQLAIASRGLNPNRSWEMNVKQDGGDISADPIGYPEAYYTPPLQSIERLELYRGSAALQFGSQFGGMINFISKSVPVNQKYTAEFSQVLGFFGTQNSYAAAGKRGPRGALYVYTNYKSSKGWRQNGYYQTYGSGFHAEYNINSKQNLHVNYTIQNNTVQQTGGIFDSDLINNADTSYRARNWMIIPWQRFTLQHHSKVKYGYYTMTCFGNYASRKSIGFTASLLFRDTLNPITSEYSKRQADEDYYQNLGMEHRQHFTLLNTLKTPVELQLGIRMYYGSTKRFQIGKGDAGSGSKYFIEPDSWKRKMDFNAFQAAGFAEISIKPLAHLTLISGLRREMLRTHAKGSIYNVNQTLPSAIDLKNTRSIWLLGCNAVYEISANLHIYGGLTQNYRPVLFSDHYAQTPNEKVVLPLRDAFGEQVDIGIKGTLKSIFSFDVNGYFIHYNNRTGLVYRADSIFKTTIGHSKTYGLSIYFDCNTNALFKNKNSEIQSTLFSAITLNNARYCTFNTGINNFSGHFLEYAPVWSVKSGITIAYKTLKLQWTLYAQRLSYSDPSNAKTANLSANIGPLPGYYIHDLGLTYIFKKTITWSIMASNLCNSRYYTRRANGYPGPGLIPGMPRYISFALSYSI